MPENLFLVIFLLLACMVVFRMVRKIATPSAAKGARFDTGVLAALRNHGDPLTAERPVDVYLYLPTEAAARQVASDIAADGFSIDRIGPEPGGKKFACQASKVMMPDPDAITAMRIRLEAVASAHGGEYDGWGCAVTGV